MWRNYAQQPSSKIDMTNIVTTEVSREQRLLQLQVRCQLQREYLARDAQALQPILRGMDQCAEVVKVANQCSTPLKYGILAGLAGLMLSRPKKALSLAVTAMRYWSWWQKLSPLFTAATASFKKSSMNNEDAIS